MTTSLLIADLLDTYRSGRDTPTGVMTSLLDAADRAPDHRAWITRLPRKTVLAFAADLAARRDSLPLFGVPFVVKDNIDLAGVPTTAGCPDFAYTPTRSAFVVQRLIEAGAIPLGKSNLDQFATGLVGTRSPYGACRNSINPEFISGGSSSGSAVLVASGLASFSLGTDTAGSGRVPAAFNNLIGLKPSNGRLSTTGVVPACRSLDCVSIFALTAEDAAAVLDVAEGFDDADPYARHCGNRAAGLRIGIPRRSQLQFFGDAEYARLFDEAVHRVSALGGTVVDIDFEPFLEAARLLYQGPWVAERFAAVGNFVGARPDSVHPVTRQVIESGRTLSAVAAFQGEYRRKALQRQTDAAWTTVDVILTPTAGTIYRVADVAEDPVQLNSNLGYYTNFMNLFDLCGVAVPAGFRSDGLPFGVTLVGPRGSERDLLTLAGRLHRAGGGTMGAGTLTIPAHAATFSLREGYVALAVCGAHMQGLPLNPQLRDRGGYRVQVTTTAPHYRLYALPGGPPRRPGLIRAGGGAAIAVEVWALPTEHVGSFLAGIPAPLGLGKIELADGSWVTGFICEGYAAEGATDVTRHGGWRDYLEAAQHGGL